MLKIENEVTEFNGKKRKPYNPPVVTLLKMDPEFVLGGTVHMQEGSTGGGPLIS